MRTAAKVFLIAVLSLTFVRGASAYEAPTLPIHSVTTGVALTLPAGLAPGAPGTGTLKTALAGGVVLAVSFDDDDDYWDDCDYDDDYCDYYDDDYDDEDDDEDWVY
jgi:hypothetical protein